MTKRYKALRGTRDILPDEATRWQLLEETTRHVFSRYGFREIRTPIIEATELFARSVGASSDIVRKEMYTFASGDESVCLRPENTASVVRAVVEHSLHRGIATGYPERYFYLGPMFRYERPQKGRQRQFHQIGVEVLGSAEPAADAETIEMADHLLDSLHLGRREIVLNSVGDAVCRPAYRRALCDWLEPRLSTLCEDCNRRYRDNPLRVFDCKVEADRELLARAPTVLEMLCGDCKGHFAAVRSALDGLGVGYRIDPHIVRGLDYYARTVFEITSPELGAQNAILGGGRYDGLVEELGGPAVPGFGFSIGMERVVMLMPERDAKASGPDVALVPLDDAARSHATVLARRLRHAGLACVLPLSERPMGAQLRRADKLGTRFALLMGAEELASGEWTLKDLRSGQQETITEAGLIARIGGAEHGD